MGRRAERERRAVQGIARVRARRRVTIPQPIRQATGARPGAALLVQATGPDRLEVVVLPTVTADDFFAAMALGDGLGPEDLQRAVVAGVAERVLPAGRYLR